MNRRVITIDGVAYVRADSIKAEDMKRDEFAAAVLEAVAHVSLVSASELTGRSRSARLSTLRAAAIGIMRDVGNLPWEAIGDAMGRDHSTVIACSRKHGETRVSRRIRKLAIQRMGQSE